MANRSYKLANRPYKLANRPYKLANRNKGFLAPKGASSLLLAKFLWEMRRVALCTLKNLLPDSPKLRVVLLTAS